MPGAPNGKNNFFLPRGPVLQPGIETHAPAVVVWSPNHWTTRKVPPLQKNLLKKILFCTHSMWDLNSLMKDRTLTPCIGKQSLNHWTITQVLRPWKNLDGGKANPQEGIRHLQTQCDKKRDCGGQRGPVSGCLRSYLRAGVHCCCRLSLSSEELRAYIQKHGG